MDTHLHNVISEGITEASSVTQFMLNTICVWRLDKCYMRKQQATSLKLQYLPDIVFCIF